MKQLKNTYVFIFIYHTHTYTHTHTHTHTHKYTHTQILMENDFHLLFNILKKNCRRMCTFCFHFLNKTLKYMHFISVVYL